MSIHYYVIFYMFKRKLRIKVLRKISFLKDMRLGNVTLMLNDNRKKLYKLLMLYCYLLSHFFKYYTYLYFKQCSRFILERSHIKYRSVKKIFNKRRRRNRYIRQFYSYRQILRDYEDVSYNKIKTLFGYLCCFNKGFTTNTFNDLFNKLFNLLHKSRKNNASHRLVSAKKRKRYKYKWSDKYISRNKLKFIIRLIKKYVFKYRRVFKLLPQEGRLYFANLQYLNNLISYNSALASYACLVSLRNEHFNFMHFFNFYIHNVLKYVANVSHIFSFNNLHKLLTNYYKYSYHL